MKPAGKNLKAAAIILLTLATLFAGGVVTFSLVVSFFVAWEMPQKHLLEGLSEWPLVVLVLAGVAFSKPLGWKWIAVGALLPASLLVFLAHDHKPVRLPDLGSRSGVADPGYQTMMWLGRGGPYSHATEVPHLKDTAVDDALTLPDDPGKRAAFLRENRAMIESAWTEYEGLRNWADRVSANPPCGVWLGGAGLIEYLGIKRLVHVATCYSALQLSLGRPEAALKAVEPLIEAMYVLQRTGPGLVNEIVPAVALGATLSSAVAAVEDPAASREDRESLRRILAHGPGLPTTLRNMFVGEDEFWETVVDRAATESGPVFFAPDLEISQRLVNAAMRFSGRLFLNRNTTVALHVETLKSAEAVSLSKDPRLLATWKPPSPTLSQQLRNPLGRLLEGMGVPAFDKAVEHVWYAEDLREKTLVELGKLLGPP
jgi:hypothetical protein